MTKRILVGCEFSARVRDAFRNAGHDAWSCDLRPTEGDPAYHIQGDVMEQLDRGWDMAIFHPDCTHLTLAGARWFYDARFPDKHRQRDEAIEFFTKLKNAPIMQIAVENPQPLGYVTDRVGMYSQKVQPWQFGDKETKGICWWLKYLPPLVPTVKKKPEGVIARVHLMPPSANRQKERSRFDFDRLLSAMVKTWGEA